jgi:hypothetical protein
VTISVSANESMFLFYLQIIIHICPTYVIFCAQKKKYFLSAENHYWITEPNIRKFHQHL